jgi:hypothetical protein
MGLKHLGKGYSADVFQHPTMPDVAVKVFIYDPGFATYAKFCAQHESNPYLLKIFDYHNDPKGFNFEGSEGDKPNGLTSANIVFVEKLQPASSAAIKHFTAYCEQLAKFPATGKTLGYYADYGNEKLNLRLWAALAQQGRDRELQQFARWYNKQIKGDDHIPDVHDSNVMVRGTQMVFSDPIA